MDYQVFQFINQFARINDVLDYFFIFCAQILVLFLGFGVMGLAIVRLKKWGKEMFFDAAIGASVALFINWVIPIFYHRPRPFVDHLVNQLVFKDSGDKSFPSDHAALSFALAMAAYQYDKKWGSVFFIFALFISLGRIASGIHYPFDVFGGAVIGVFSSFFVKRFLDSLLRKSGAVKSTESK
ncbi:MAG TPA: phosphatase PAP2 family protein [Patescibacteria group bacterium]|nr:phosphatase PAP2 family protein [Patescibacteria group bacterium]